MDTGMPNIVSVLPSFSDPLTGEVSWLQTENMIFNNSSYIFNFISFQSGQWRGDWLDYIPH